MARERRRLLIPPPRLAERIPLTAPERHYLRRVLRLGAGQGCDVVDGAGHRWGARLTAEGLLELEQPLIAPLEAAGSPTPLLELAVALPRQEVEVVWRMAAELGLDRLQPLQAERCQGRERCPLDRWRTIVREASEQCERLWLPELAEPVAAATWLAAPGVGFRAAAGAEAGAGFRAGEAPGEGLNLLASSRGDALPLLPSLLATTQDAGHDGAIGIVRVAIGPEGGWSPAEEELARARGWIAVSAGPTILRTVTAAVAAAAWLSSWRGSLSSSSSPSPSP
jgi:16S rRNA (uracil1498-N3)-methyltransferase